MVGERERGHCTRLQNPFVFLNILDIGKNSQYRDNSGSKKANDLGYVTDAGNLIYVCGQQTCGEEVIFKGAF